MKQVNEKMTISEFIDYFCQHHDINRKVLLGKNRSFELVNLRASLVAILKDDWQAKNSVIARELKRDESTIINLLKRGVKESYLQPKNPLASIK